MLRGAEAVLAVTIPMQACFVPKSPRARPRSIAVRSSEGEARRIPAGEQPKEAGQSKDKEKDNDARRSMS